MSSFVPVTATGRAQRLDAVDALRGAAIVVMIAYHFCFDLVLFRLADWRMLHDPAWIAWRSTILSSFLLLAGVSLQLRARYKSAWPDFWRRWLQIAGAAALVTAGSAWMFPQSFIYFGVLHHLALMLIVGRLMLPLRAWNLPIGTAVIVVGIWAQHAAFNPKWINWIGFVTVRPYTEDYVPVFPWFGVILLGIWLGDAGRAGIDNMKPIWLQNILGMMLAWLGRHSLSVYLLHQPLLLGGLWLALRVVNRGA